MKYPSKFVKATKDYNTFENFVPAPYIRKTFVSDCETKAEIVIAACGFYELFINGKKYTKGYLAPYISNTDHYIYCDKYEIEIEKGENVIGILLGNGFQNNPGGYIWDFDKSAFRSAPMVALTLTYKNSNGEEITIETDKSFKTTSSPIRSDDYRFGEIYDANFEIPSWCDKGFDDSDWNETIETKPPRGELKLCLAEPIIKETELEPVNIFEEEDGFVYNFGQSNAGVCRLKINGAKGQKVEIQHADQLKDGKFYLNNVWFQREFWERDKEIVHKDVYICKGEGEEIYTPTFVYHGFRYVKVKGITKEQATNDLLTYLVLHSNLKSRGGFVCSNDTVNKLQEITRRSEISNFHYFPTDCPQREKNGWTADAALASEHLMLNFAPEISYREWHNNIRKAQQIDGRLPGIVPTGGWGVEWGNGPAWDSILATLPYIVYIYRGETEMIKESTTAFVAYLNYLTTRRDEKGLIHIGLGDWCHVGRAANDYKTPLEFTDSVMAMDIANKMAFMFDAIGKSAQRDFAKNIANEFKTAVREHLIDFETCTVAGQGQSGQAMAIYYEIFTEEESKKAFEVLLERIKEADEHIDVGVLGGRVLFHVLTKFGYSDLALKMIIRPDYPSYGNWLERGATTLWEDFFPNTVSSMNHHFWGDISAWFIKCLAGIHFNPNGNNIKEVYIKPNFVTELDNAKGWYEAPDGEIVSAWERNGDEILLKLRIPNAISATVYLPKNYTFEDGESKKTVTSGEYTIKK